MLLLPALLTGSKTSIWHNKCTASWVACELSAYNATTVGIFWAWRNMWERAPSHAYFMSSREGVPSSSVISSNCKQDKGKGLDTAG